MGINYRIGEHQEDEDNFNDIWDTNLDIERIKRNAQRIKLNARKIAGKAAENVRGPSHSHTIGPSSYKKPFTKYSLINPVPATKLPMTSKKKRRFKLSGKSSMGIGGALFWGFIAYQCFFTGNDEVDKTSKVTTTDKVVEQVKTTINNVKPEVQALFDKAKGEFDKVVKEEKSKRPPKVANNNDPFAQDDDRYKSIEDKW